MSSNIEANDLETIAQKDQAAIGIDLGGTYVKGVVTDPEGNILGWEKMPTEGEKGVEHVLCRVEALVNSLSKKGRNVMGVGVGIPGMLDISGEKVFLAPNLEWKNIYIKQSLNQRLKMPIYLENDANVAALGEAWLGSGKDSSCFVLVTIGTGIGSGLIIEGRIFRGANGMAAELGHMTITDDDTLCTCGCRGCLETLVSAPAILRLGLEKGIVPEGSEAGQIMELAKTGNHDALGIVNQVMEYLAVGLKNTILLLDLNLIIIGGGIGDWAEIFIDTLRETTVRLLPVRREINIVPAALGNKAGALGAARLVFTENNFSVRQ